jgi:hypothetical protein
MVTIVAQLVALAHAGRGELDTSFEQMIILFIYPREILPDNTNWNTFTGKQPEYGLRSSDKASKTLCMM